MKKLAIFIGVLLVVVIAVVIYAASQSERLVREAVEKHGPRVTKTAISLGDVELNLWRGKAALSNLTVGNPEGFDTAHAFDVDEMMVSLDVSSLLGDVVHVREIRIKAPDLIYEVGVKGDNIGRIQKNITAYTESLGLAASESQTKFIIDHIYINNAKVKLASDFLQGNNRSATLPDIHLKNIGNEDAAATASEVAVAVVDALHRHLGEEAIQDLRDKAADKVKKKLEDIFK